MTRIREEHRTEEPTRVEAGRGEHEEFDPVLLAVLANRFEAIVREMSNTLLRSARSAALTVARDFSCAIVTGENELLATAEGLPAHILGAHLQTKYMQELHPDLAEGDAFLDNDPYVGNTHHADHTVLVPVFVDGIHLFTTSAKGHQADCGNALPTTYMAFAKDIYEEGAINFPCVRVQKDYEEVDDIIRMARRRIRVPDQWYGDYLATLGACRIGERRLKELVEKYGIETIKAYQREWFDYSERRMADAISRLPSGRVVGKGRHDSLPGLPEGIPVKAEITVDPTAQKVEVDLRDNIDAIPAGLNVSKAVTLNSAVAAIFNVLDEDVPRNAGSFRRIAVAIRENCVVGITKHPTSNSVSTTNVPDRLVNCIQAAFAEMGEGLGLAEGGVGAGVAAGVISGADFRRGGAPYVNEVILASNGGPASPVCDGWVSFQLPVVAGVVYRDSVEVDEQKFPILVKSLEMQPDSGGPGRWRGAPAARVVFGPKQDPMTIAYPVDGAETPSQGVRGGLPGGAGDAAKIGTDGTEEPLPYVAAEEIQPGEFVVGVCTGGGGYGSPLEREPARVLHDVSEKIVSLEAARDTYGVVFSGEIEDEGLSVDQEATRARRRELKEASA